MVKQVLVCADNISADLSCPSGWEIAVYSAPFDISQVSVDVAVSYFAAGFALPIAPLAAALGASFLLKIIRG